MMRRSPLATKLGVRGATVHATGIACYTMGAKALIRRQMLTFESNWTGGTAGTGQAAEDNLTSVALWLTVTLHVYVIFTI
jgi:hypothetical protein